MVFVFSLATKDARKPNTGVYYDCSIASFQPDVPLVVKEACYRRQVYDQDAAAIAEQQKRHPKHDSTKR
jgi:hypothetical protein